MLKYVEETLPLIHWLQLDWLLKLLPKFLGNLADDDDTDFFGSSRMLDSSGLASKFAECLYNVSGIIKNYNKFKAANKTIIDTLDMMINAHQQL